MKLQKKASVKERSKNFSALKEKLLESFSEEEIEEKGNLINSYFSKVEKDAVRELVLSEGIRLDGRKTDDIRPIWCEVNYLPSTHGSSIFTRGETQALATVTLGTSRDANIIDSPTHQGEENFYLHYNFPLLNWRGQTIERNFKTGNWSWKFGSKSTYKSFPIRLSAYTVREVSEVLESNGSSSMATVCSGTMALMDAGVKISKPVSGIAMGLISDGKRYSVLSDILGDEDHLGDMDFKVTGTEDGITACQMDIKIKGLSYEILEKALEQAKDGRLKILNEMTKTIEKPSEEVKEHAPKMVKIEIDGSYIGAVIGPGGKVIQEMQKETGTTIVIEEEDEKGIIEILGTDQNMIDSVIQKIEDITFKPEVGKTYNVKVIKILDFGAVVEFRPSKEVLLHVSEIDWKRVEKVEDYLKIGDRIDVKYMGIDPRTKSKKFQEKY